MANSNIFMGKTVHEVGAGIGLPILYASFYCKRAIFSDYMTSLIDNYNYNVKCNTHQIDEIKDKLVGAGLLPQGDENDQNGQIEQTQPLHYRHSKLWDVIFQNQHSVEKRIEDEENEVFSANPENDYPQIDLNSAQIEFENDQIINNIPINHFIPNTCLTHSETCGCEGYVVSNNYETLKFDTDQGEIMNHRFKCLTNMHQSSQGLLFDWLNFDQLPPLLKDDLKCDIILGSEVSYPTILDTLPALVHIIDTTLSQFGAFYLVQSPNRGTSHYFIEALCAEKGLLLDMRVVDLKVLDEFSSGQRNESYVYYTFRRPDSPYPIMGIENDYVAPVSGLSSKSLVLINTNRQKMVNGQWVDADEISFEIELAAPVPEVVKVEVVVDGATANDVKLDC